MSVLGAVFIDNECLRKVEQLIDVTDFYREVNRKIFQSMSHLRLQGSPIDFVSMSNVLKANGELEEIGGAAYLIHLADIVPTSQNVSYYCKTVKEAANRRRMIQMCDGLSRYAYEGKDLSEIILDARDGISELQSCMDSMGGVSLSDLSTFKDRLDHYQNKINTVDRDRFITGYKLLDAKIRGVCPGEVLTIVAEPGGFKTAFLQNLLMNGSKRTKKQSLLFSMEMPDEKIFEREVQIECSTSGWDVERHFRAQGYYGLNIDAFTKSQGTGLTVCSKTRLPLEKMERYIELARQKHGEMAAVGIDFIQLMPGPGKIFDRIEHNAYGVKTLAKSLNVPIILLSQINVSGRKEKGCITFSDAKGGGAIEEAADIGLGFYHDKSGSLICEGLKNRNGPKGWRLEADIDRKSFKFNDFIEYEQVSQSRSTKDDLPL
jgi:replicative DNA helicase